MSLFGSKVPDTSGQNAAAQTQAGIAQDMWNQYKTTYEPMEASYVQQAQDYNTPEHQEQAAEAANADVVSSFDAQKDQAARQMSSYGISPDSGKFQSINNRLNLGQAAQQAAAQTGARRQVEQTGWDRQTQALSLGKGLPAQASTSAAGAGSTFGNIANEQMAGNQQESNDIAGAVGGGVGLYNSFSDGGLVDTKKKKAFGIHRPVVVVHHRPVVIIDKHGVQHLAYGGPAGALGMARQAGAYGAPAGGNSIANSMIQGAQMGAGLYKAGSSIASKINAMMHPVDVTANSGLGGGAADEAISGTTDMLSGAGADAAGAGTAAGAAGAADAAAATGAAAADTAGVSAALEGIGAAAPEVLAALALNTGGRVRNEIPGGGIRGPGTTTSDSIPARLSDGEFVLNAEAVKHFGVDKLEKMNEVGLQKRYGIRR